MRPSDKCRESHDHALNYSSITEPNKMATAKPFLRQRATSGLPFPWQTCRNQVAHQSAKHSESVRSGYSHRFFRASFSAILTRCSRITASMAHRLQDASRHSSRLSSITRPLEDWKIRPSSELRQESGKVSPSPKQQETRRDSHCQNGASRLSTGQQAGYEGSKRPRWRAECYSAG